MVRRTAPAAGVAITMALVLLSLSLFKPSADHGGDASDFIPKLVSAASVVVPAGSNFQADATVASPAPSLPEPANWSEFTSLTSVAAAASPTETEGDLAAAGTGTRESHVGAPPYAPTPEAGFTRAGSLEDRDSTTPGITTLADGSAEAVLTYAKPGPQTIYVKVPSDWDLASAQLHLAGEAYAVEQVDQKNEASRYNSTWGVRAQQFRPTGVALNSVELFLAHTSPKAADLTVEIREDDGNGYPSTNVKTSVSKPVPVGGYRWEMFDLAQVQVDPGQSYWIVSYVKPLDQIVYPTIPSVGDYGYYLGMSTRDEYPEGDSADFLTFATGSRWEKYASRSSWDLMFQVNGLAQYFPGNLRLDVGSDGGAEWTRPGELRDTEETGDLSSEMGDFLHAMRGVAGAEMLVPLLIESDSPGVVRVSNIRISRKPSP